MLFLDYANYVQECRLANYEIVRSQHYNEASSNKNVY